jgi:GNAT superfamily N-acetyltransferase
MLFNDLSRFGCPELNASPKNNLERMIQLADEFFSVKRDPSQISVNGRVLARLRHIHPGTISEKSTSKGPVAWVLVIPTTQTIMDQFISKKITERELYNKTPLHAAYSSIYLCSALVLPEYRRKGLAKKLLIKAIKTIQKDHPVQKLFSWAFSAEGKRLAASVAREVSLPLYSRV